MNYTHILFVDDDEISSFLNHQLIKELDPSLHVHTISSGEQAIEYLQAGNRADLIFLDLNMPGMDGFEFISAFDFNKTNTKIVILTATELPPEKMAQLNQINCCDVMLKPLTIEKIDSLLFQKN